MDGENHGKPYEQMDDLGGFPIIFGGLTPIWNQQKGSYKSWNLPLQNRRCSAFYINFRGE